MISPSTATRAARPRQKTEESGVVAAPPSKDQKREAGPPKARGEVNPLLKLFAFAQAYTAAAAELRKREEGQTMAEYGVVLAVITLAVITAITLLSTNVRSAISSVANILPGS
jgi:Flp pilus assembly pilin Flp